jgi:hypothetical protein
MSPRFDRAGERDSPAIWPLERQFVEAGNTL